MSSRSFENQFPISLYATPNPLHREVFYTIPRAGHLIAGPNHHIQREHFPGHELILCLRGSGWVRIAGRTSRVRRGDFVWINCHRPHEHGAIKSDPWEVYWVRIEGPRLEQMCNILSVATNPVLTGFDLESAVPIFQELFTLIPSNAPEAPALIHAAVARLLALAFCARCQPEAATLVPPVLSKAVERMKLFYFERHSVGALAGLSGMSPTHFARTFKAAFGTSPIDWLRRERISQAKRRLAESDASIKEIAAQVGYADRYFFSKDFKQHTGTPPEPSATANAATTPDELRSEECIRMRSASAVPCRRDALCAIPVPLCRVVSNRYSETPRAERRTKNEELLLIQLLPCYRSPS